MSPWDPGITDVVKCPPSGVSRPVSRIDSVLALPKIYHRNAKSLLDLNYSSVRSKIQTISEIRAAKGKVRSSWMTDFEIYNRLWIFFMNEYAPQTFCIQHKLWFFYGKSSTWNHIQCKWTGQIIDKFNFIYFLLLESTINKLQAGLADRARRAYSIDRRTRVVHGRNGDRAAPTCGHVSVAQHVAPSYY